MSKYEEAVIMKQDFQDFEKRAAGVLRSVVWSWPDNKPEPTRGEAELVDAFAEAVATDKISKLLIQVVSIERRKKLDQLTREAWVEMSDLFKDFTMDLRAEVDQLKEKLEDAQQPVVAVMP